MATSDAIAAVINQVIATRATGRSQSQKRRGLCLYCQRQIQAPPEPQYCPDCLVAARQAARQEIVTRSIATIPESYRWATFDDPNLAQRVNPASQIRLARAATGAGRVLLSGRAGAGKTSLACAIFCAAVARLVNHKNAGADSCFVAAYDLARASGEHALGAGTPQLVLRAERAELLLLDDFGSEPDIKNSPVADVIYTRHANAKRTIVTTGYTAEQLTRRYGDGIVRRLIDRAVLIKLG